MTRLIKDQFKIIVIVAIKIKKYTNLSLEQLLLFYIVNLAEVEAEILITNQEKEIIAILQFKC